MYTYVYIYIRISSLLMIRYEIYLSYVYYPPIYIIHTYHDMSADCDVFVNEIPLSGLTHQTY